MNLVEMLQGATSKEIAELIGGLKDEEILAILDDWSLWALDYQRLPEGDWRRWILRAGRGTGKTYTAARITNEIAKDRKKIRTGDIGIIAQTWSAARETCVEGPSGILATAPTNFRPEWYPGRGLLVWPNAVKARIFSAERPETMRGNNWAWVWADELCFWGGDVQKTWDSVIEPALRMGWARAMITTTPKPDSYLRTLEEREGSIVTRASTYDNKYLSAEARAAYTAMKGTRWERQEIYGDFSDGVKGALWSLPMIARNRVSVYPDLSKVVVAIDPAATANEDSDETGIVAFGSTRDGDGYVLEDASGRYEPSEWGLIAYRLYRRWKADKVVAEVNHGGDMVEHVIRTTNEDIPYEGVRAKRGKELRAHPISVLSEKGKIRFCGDFPKLEEQLTTWVPGVSPKSPDRLDAFVYAATSCLLENTTRDPRAYFNLRI